MKTTYENRSANPGEAKKANELEDELRKTKTYYQKRIRELEDKYKFNAGKEPKKAAEEKQIPVKDKGKAQNEKDAEGEEEGIRVKEQLVKLTQLRQQVTQVEQ